MDVVLVINAGSSSVKFSVFGVSGARLNRICTGNFEEIDTKPHLRIRHESGENLAEKRWSAGEPLGHEGAIAFLFEWLHSHAAGYRAIAAGHRFVHGGSRYATAVRVDDHVIADLEALVPLAPLHQRSTRESGSKAWRIGQASRPTSTVTPSGSWLVS